MNSYIHISYLYVYIFIYSCTKINKNFRWSIKYTIPGWCQCIKMKRHKKSFFPCKWRPSFSCPLRNCLLLRRSDWCCYCWIQNHGSMLGSSYRLQIPVLQWRITPDMCQTWRYFSRKLMFRKLFFMIFVLKLDMFRFVVFCNIFETCSTTFASRRASSSRHWSYSRCGLQPHCRRCSGMGTEVMRMFDLTPQT